MWSRLLVLGGYAAIVILSVGFTGTAVHAHAQYDIYVVASQPNICCDGSSPVTVTVEVHFAPPSPSHHIHLEIRPLSGQTSYGSLSATEGNTNGSGQVTVTYTPGTDTGQVEIKAIDTSQSNQYDVCTVTVTRPDAPVVTDDGDFTLSMTSLHATWTPGSQTEYKYAIGTSRGGTDIVDWTSTGTNAYVTKDGLSLQAGVAYYFSVKYRDANNCWSHVGYSDGIYYRGECGASFAYDSRGNRESMTDSRGTTTYDYDALGRVERVTEPGGDRWVGYEYDLGSNRTEMTVHLDATTEHVTGYEYNSRGLLDTVTDQLEGETTYTYKDNGLVDTITYPNTTKTIHSYNSRNWLTTISNQTSGSAIIAEFTYEYDTTHWGKNGTRTAVVENILTPSGSTPTSIRARVDYEYDDLYRLVHEHRIDDPAVSGADAGVEYVYNFEYDPAGNRTSWQVNGGTPTSYGYNDANQMTSPGTFTYDDAGNMLTHGTTTYAWDCMGRLSRWAKTGETAQDYVYNGDGMRVGKAPDGGTATSFLLDGKEIVEETTGQNTTSYVGPGLISSVHDGTRTTYHADGLGSTRATSNGSQAVQMAAVYHAYGNRAVDYPNGSAPEFGFAGQDRYYADSTGLDYVKARYYGPAVGRFISRDPIGYAGGLNLYAYVNNDPVHLTDPSGLSFLYADRSACSYYDTQCTSGLRLACSMATACRIFGNSCREQCMRGCLIALYDECVHKSGWRRTLCESSYLTLGHGRCFEVCYNGKTWLGP